MGRTSRIRTGSLPRQAAKAVFAGADLLLGDWPGPRILIYHQVGAGLGREMEVTVEVFRRQLGWLESRGRIVSLEEAVAARAEPEASRLFVLTFDDGYEDLYTRAFPLLRERGLPFALYLTTEPVETGVPLTPGGRADPLRWVQVDEMLESGLLTLGVHTHRHRDLRGLSPHHIEEELDTSDRLVESRTGTRPRHFAYPKGHWDPVAEDLLRERYATAALGAGPPITPSTDPLRLHRLPIQRSDGLFFFRRKVLRGMRVEEWVRRRLRRYEGPPID